MLNIFAPINILGYGVHAANIIKSLTDKDKELTLTKLGQVQSDPLFESYWKQAEKNLLNFNAKAPSLFIFHDEHSNQASGSPLAVFSVFETTKLKPLSKTMLMRGPADMIFVTTEEHANILKENGIQKPIHVVHEGVDPEIYNTFCSQKYIETNKFTFITAGKCEKRKNTNLIIESFMKASEGKEVALIAHTFNPFLNNKNDHPFKNLSCWVGFDPATYGFRYVGWNGKAHRFIKDKVDIYFTAPTLPTVEMPNLYHSANVGIQCSNAEGWDLPLSDMLACGLPTIATMCLGHKEYLRGLRPHLDDLLIHKVGSQLANDGLWFKGDQGDWDAFETLEIKNKIKLVLDNMDKFTVKNEEIATYMATNFPWSKTADEITTILSLGG